MFIPELFIYHLVCKQNNTSVLPVCVHLIRPSTYSCTSLAVLPGEVVLLKISHKLPHLLLHPLLDNLPSPASSCRGSLHPVMKCRLLLQHIPHGRRNQLSAETEGVILWYPWSLALECGVKIPLFTHNTLLNHNWRHMLHAQMCVRIYIYAFGINVTYSAFRAYILSVCIFARY